MSADPSTSPFQSSASVAELLERDESYRTDHLLSQGEGTLTEVVWRGAKGPYVRKRMRVELTSPEAWLRLGKASSAHLPQLEDLFELPGELVAVTDFVPGDSLNDIVEREGALSAVRAVEVLKDVANAVQALHNVGVVHRDITPKNVIVGARGASLIDLGIARVAGEARSTKAQIQHDTTVLGTWGFAAPEQFGFKATDVRSDVYGLGRLLGFMLTGVYPDDSQYQPILLDPQKVDPKLATVVTKATAFEPSSRPASAQALSEEAQSAMKRHRSKVALLSRHRFVFAALALLAVGVTAALAWLSFWRTPETLPPVAMESSLASPSQSEALEYADGDGEASDDSSSGRSSWYELGVQVAEQYAQGIRDGGSDAVDAARSLSQTKSEEGSQGTESEPMPFSVAIDSAELTEDYEGNPALMVALSFRNDSDKTTSFASNFLVDAYQDGKQLDMAGSTDKKLNQSTKNLRSGASNTCYELFALTSSNPVEVEVLYLPSFDAGPVATKTFTLS